MDERTNILALSTTNIDPICWFTRSSLIYPLSLLCLNVPYLVFSLVDYVAIGQ